MKKRYYSESLLRSLAYEDDVNGNCDGTIDFTVIDCISGADVAPVVHGEWVYDHWREFKCSECGQLSNSKPYKGKERYCPNCGACMNEGGK